MIAYRLCIAEYREDLSGTGAKLFGGRWNSVGMPALYTAENISLAVLEMLVRTDINHIPLNYYLVKIDLPKQAAVKRIEKNKLKREWKTDASYTQWIGDEFLHAKNGLILQLPSAIVDEEHNFVINPAHEDFKKIKISSSKKFSFDKRLF